MKTRLFLYNFVRNTQKITQGQVVVVTHGPELRAFAKENYSKYQGAIDKMAELAAQEKPWSVPYCYHLLPCYWHGCLP